MAQRPRVAVRRSRHRNGESHQRTCRTMVRCNQRRESVAGRPENLAKAITSSGNNRRRVRTTPARRRRSRCSGFLLVACIHYAKLRIGAYPRPRGVCRSQVSNDDELPPQQLRNRLPTANKLPHNRRPANDVPHSRRSRRQTAANSSVSTRRSSIDLPTSCPHLGQQTAAEEPQRASGLNVDMAVCATCVINLLVGAVFDGSHLMAHIAEYPTCSLWAEGYFKGLAAIQL
jgi:hypothetical protein